MAAIARGNQKDKVLSKTGSGDDCKYPKNTTTGTDSSDKVFIQGFGAVVAGDRVGPHSKRDCVPDTSVLTTYSSKVFVGGKGVGRIGDKYTDDNIIVSGSDKVFIGG